MTDKEKPMVTAVYEEPLFRSVKGALMFSLNYSHGQLKKPFLVQLMGGGRSGRGLGGLDGAGQAGMIQVELDRLKTTVAKAVLVAKFSNPSTPCACRSVCCRGWRESPEWAEAINWLTGHVLTLGLGTKGRNYRFRRALVSRYFGVKESFIKMSTECGVERDTAAEQYKKISEYLKQQVDEARGELDGLLKTAGVVE